MIACCIEIYSFSSFFIILLPTLDQYATIHTIRFAYRFYEVVGLLIVSLHVGLVSTNFNTRVLYFLKLIVRTLTSNPRAQQYIDFTGSPGPPGHFLVWDHP